VLLFCFALSACQDLQEKASIAARDAERALDAGDLNNAEILAQRATQLRDSEAAYWTILGRIQLQRNKLGEAYSSFQRVVELDPGNLNAIQIVSELAFQAEEKSLADEMADRALVLAPSSTRALLVKGLIALDKGKPDVAQELATKILDIDPKDEFGIVLAARALAAKGDIDQAALLIGRDIEVNKRSEASLVTLVELHRRTGNYAALKASLQTLIEKQPESLQLPLDYADILYRGGEANAARSMIFRVIADKAVTYENIVAAKQLWQAFDKAPLSKEQIGTLAKSNALTTRLEVAKFYLDQNDAAAAKRLLTIELDDLESSAKIQANGLQAKIAYIEGKRAEALAKANSVIGKDKTNAEARIVRSLIRQQNGDLTGALEDAQVAVENFRENELARFQLIEILHKRDGQLRALQSLADGLEAMPQSSLMARYAVGFLLNLKLPDRAVGVAEQFTSDNPSSVKGWEILMIACKSIGKASCQNAANGGLSYAKSTYTIDQRPGSRKTRGLFGDLKIDCSDGRRFCRQ
jgi:tetratricopeptide (TPR) repeat protein